MHKKLIWNQSIEDKNVCVTKPVLSIHLQVFPPSIWVKKWDENVLSTSSERIFGGRIGFIPFPRTF